MPALPSCLIEPIWEQFSALLPERHDRHPLGCHRPRIGDRMVFELLVNVLVFGSGYRRHGDRRCSATTLRRRRDEWIGAGVIGRLEAPHVRATTASSGWNYWMLPSMDA